MASGEAQSVWRSVSVILQIILAIFIVSVPSITVAQALEEEQEVACPHSNKWKPADLPHILLEHRKWVERTTHLRPEFHREGYYPYFPPELTEEGFSQGRANLCNADLREAKLNHASLAWAKLNNADLFRAKLNNADLHEVDLTNADLRDADLTNASLARAKLTNANLSRVNVDRARLPYTDVWSLQGTETG